VVTLENSRLFAELDARDMQSLRRIAQEHSFPEGQEVFQEGSSGDAIYVVKQGLIEICVNQGGAAQVLSKAEPGDFFGEMAVLEQKGRSASAIAREASVCYRLPREGILKLVEDSPPLALSLLRQISSRLRDSNQQYLNEVLQAERLAIVGRFARSIVHDLKNPLNIIGLTAEIAGMSNSTIAMRQQAVATIRSQIDRISELVSDILDFTQGTPTSLVLSASDFAGFVNQVVQELRSEATLKNVVVELSEPPPSLPLVINPKRLRRVFHNLTQNAIEAMGSNGKILLRFEVKPTEVVTEFEDTGPGIAPEIAGRLFEAFASHGKVNGTGLGLSICRRIIQDHKGWIVARHEPGRGAIFAFGLPRPEDQNRNTAA